jgi:hypothetical protein
MSEFGPAFDAAQRAYDRLVPDESPEGPTCEECGEQMVFTEYSRTRRWLVWSARCKCGNTQSYEDVDYE